MVPNISLYLGERLNSTRRPKETKEPEPTATVVADAVVSEDRLELVLPVTSVETLEFIELFKLVSIEEAKNLLLVAMRKAAEEKRGSKELSALVARARPNPNLNFLDEEETVNV